MGAENLHNDLAARLYLQAVLPAMEDLSRISSRARDLIADWSCSLEVAVANHISATVHFRDGTVTVSEGRCRDAAISLWFASSLQLVNQFAGTGISLPLPRRGFFRLASLLRFHRIGRVLEKELEQHSCLMLGVALRSVDTLVRLDAAAREAMRDHHSGLAEFGVPASGLFGWLKWENGKVTWGHGRAGGAPDVWVHFRDEQTALAALRGELDEWASIGAGDLQVRGFVPLADSLSVVMQRMEIYVKRQAAKFSD